MIDSRRPKKTMDQVLAHTESLIGQRLGLTAKAPQQTPDREALAAAHAAGEEGNAQAWLAGWKARVNGGSLDEVAKDWPGDLGLQADAIIGWREADKHMPVRQRVRHWSRRPDILPTAATPAHISGDGYGAPPKSLDLQNAGDGARSGQPGHQP